MAKNITKKKLKWYGHVKSRDEGQVGKLDASVGLPGTRRRRIQQDRERVGLKEEEVVDRTKWTNDIQYDSGDPR